MNRQNNTWALVAGLGQSLAAAWCIVIAQASTPEAFAPALIVMVTSSLTLFGWIRLEERQDEMQRREELRRIGL